MFIDQVKLYWPPTSTGKQMSAPVCSREFLGRIAKASHLKQKKINFTYVNDTKRLNPLRVNSRIQTMHLPEAKSILSK